MTSASSLRDGCGTESVGYNLRVCSLSAAVSFASSEDSSVVLIGAYSVSSLCRRAPLMSSGPGAGQHHVRAIFAD